MMTSKTNRKVFIRDGDPVGVIGSDLERCRREGDALLVLPDERWGNPVFADACLADRDFHIHAKLSLDRLAGDGASLLLGGQYCEHWTRPEGNHTFRICFDEDVAPSFKSPAKQMRIVYGRTEPRRPWVPGDDAPGRPAAGVSRDFFRPGEPFTIDLSRQGETLVFSINGREVFRTGPGEAGLVPFGRRGEPGAPVNFGLLPGRGTLRIYEFRAEGQFAEPAFPTTDAWQLNSGGYSHYRTPALCVTAGGRLLAFAEARRAYLSRGWEWEHIQGIEILSGEIHCVMKHSDDDGRTWSEQKIVIDRGATYDARYPVPLPDRETGELFLFTQGAWVIASRDDGQTWSGPRSLTGALPGNWKSGNFNKSMVPGTANSAIQLRRGRFKGRLLVAFHAKSAVGLVQSDDHGKTWQPGALAAVDMAGDPSVVELSDGRVLASPRIGPRNGQPPPGRPFLVSHDGGASFAETRFEPDLPASGQGAILAVDLPDAGAAGTVRPIVFCGAAERGTRLTMIVSLDDGRTWPVSRVIDDGSAANLALVALPGGEVGVLYERDKYRRLSFQRVNLARLIGNAS
jgi:sialidase-1